ncbi:CPBP family intramembrane glutamic endopeptidase [Ligilactobacillus sp. LYQ135]
MCNKNKNKHIYYVALIAMITILAITLSAIVYAILEILLKEIMLCPTIFTNNIHVNFILSLIFGTFFCILIFKLSFMIRNKYNKHDSEQQLINLKNNWKNFLYSSFLMYLIMCIGNLIIQIIFNGINTTGTTSNQASLNATFNTSLLDKAYIIILALLLAPIIEELIYRWGILTVTKNYILKVTNHTSSNDKFNHILNMLLLIFSAAAFSLLHAPHTLNEFTLYFWMGTCIGAIYLKYNNIYASMTFHFIINTISLVVMFLN